MIVLDTNVLSEAARPAPEQRVLDWLAAQPRALLFTTAICEAEMLSGLAMLPPGKRRSSLDEAARRMFAEDFGDRVLPFDRDAAAAYAEIGAERRRMGRPIATLDAQIAAIASVLSDPARAAILISLQDGRARTAGELAFVASVSAPTASSHLAKLVDLGLITVIPQGRHRYHRLIRPETAQALEALAVLVATPSRKPRMPGPRDIALREGWTWI